jgi:NAD(P)-dependent dehydrogenase (short-subunit alcohol dehydrogenase family)
VLDVNLKGPFLCCKHGIPAIARTGGGSVVLLGSVLGAIGSPGYAAYCASKGALVNLAKQAAIEHAPDQVRVNVVSPSATDTGLFARVAARSDDPERMMQMVARNTPMQRLGTAAESQPRCVPLLEGAGFISGTVIRSTRHGRPANRLTRSTRRSSAVWVPKSPALGPRVRRWR